jgi:hypothetical protein
MSSRNLVRWLLPGMLVLMCGAGWLFLRAGLSPPAARLLTWILSTEVLPLALIAGAAWVTHLLWKSHHAWRQGQ